MHGVFTLGRLGAGRRRGVTASQRSPLQHREKLKISSDCGKCVGELTTNRFHTYRPNGVSAGISELEIKGITSKAMQYRQDITQSGVLCNATGVNYYLNSNQTKYLPQTQRPIVYVFENFHRKFAIRMAPTTDGTSKRLVHNKHILSCNSDRNCIQIGV